MPTSPNAADSEPLPRSTITAVWVAVVLLVLPILYFGAIGPIDAASRKGWLRSHSAVDDTLRTIYIPVFFAIENVPYAREAVQTYCEFFRDYIG